MKNDFKPVADHQFKLRGDWGSVDCQVLKIEPHKTLSYSWAAHGLESIVTWTLTPTSGGTRLRMEQSGFRPIRSRPIRAPRWAGEFLRQAGAGRGAGGVTRALASSR